MIIYIFQYQKAALIANGGKYMPLVTEHKRLSLPPALAKASQTL